MVDHLERARILGAKATVKSGREPQVNGGQQAPKWDDRVTGVLEACTKVFSKDLDLCEVKESVDGAWADVA